LEVGSTKVERECELAEAAGKVFLELLGVRLESARRLFKALGLGLFAEVARVGTDGLLPGQAGVELESDQAAGGSGQEERADRRRKLCVMKGFHKLQATLTDS
jgi:hypothetical protein